MRILMMGLFTTLGCATSAEPTCATWYENCSCTWACGTQDEADDFAQNGPQCDVVCDTGANAEPAAQPGTCTAVDNTCQWVQ